MLKYKKDILEKLKDAGYSTARIRKEKLLGESGLQLIRSCGEVKHTQINTLCKIIGCNIDEIIEYVDVDKNGEEMVTKRPYMTVKTDEETINSINDIAGRNNESAYHAAYRLLRDGAGIISAHPVIVYSGEDYIWVSHLGNYDLLDDDTYHRFINGKGLPLSEGEKWTDAWDSMSEAVKALGSLVAHQTDAGIVIDRWDLLLDLVKKYEITVKTKPSFAL